MSSAAKPVLVLVHSKVGAGQKKVARERFPFTEERVRASFLPPSGVRYVYDAKCPGLALRLTAQRRVYCLVKKIAGKTTRITLGRADVLRLSDAREAVADLAGRLARGENLGAKTSPVTTAPNLQAAFDDFVNRRTDMRPSTRRDYSGLWVNHVPEKLKRRSIDQIDKVALSELHASIGRTHRRTANKVMRLLSAVLAQAGREGAVRGVRLYHEEPRTRRLRGAEWSSLAAVLEDGSKHGDVFSDFFLLALETGARRAALLAMRWADLDLEAGVWVIPSNWSKNRRELAIPLIAEAVAVLRRRLEARGDSPWVFPSPSSRNGHLSEPKKAWARVCAAANLKDLTVHDLRRSVGSALGECGVAAHTISKALGHLSPASARSYIHLDVEPVRAALEHARKRRG